MDPTHSRRGIVRTSRVRHNRWVAAFLLVIALWALTGCTPEPTPTLPTPPDAPAIAPAPGDAPTIPADSPLVIFLGDSITAGYELPAAEAYPAVLQRRLAATGLPFRLVNAGVSGDSAAGGLRRIDWILSQDPALVVIELGGNDGLRGAPVRAIEENLAKIIQRTRAQGVEVLLLGMRLPPNYGEPYTTEFAEIYERVADTHQVPHVPYFMEGVAGHAALNLADGIHPNREGHQRLAAHLAAPLRERIQALAD